VQLVLIVEDEVLLRASLARQLNKLPSIEAIEAGNVHEAVQLIDNLELDLVITDLGLPDGTALDLLPHIERAQRRPSVIVVSGHLDEYREQLPTNIEMRAKPLAPRELRELVVRTLGCHEQPPPFTLTDYLQLGGQGQHSVCIEVIQEGESVGTVCVSRGEAWAATDVLGGGPGALMRLLAVRDARYECGPLPVPPPARDLTGSVESVLLDCLRVMDERRAGRPAGPPIAAITVTPAPPSVITIPPAPAKRTKPTAPAPTVPVATPPRPVTSRPSPPPAAAATSFAAGTERTPVLDTRDFDRLYDLGIDALLGRRYQEAFDALMRARSIKSTATLEANLTRLRAMGFNDA
jgi:CheY-like chemotaxis protein